MFFKKSKNVTKIGLYLMDWIISEYRMKPMDAYMIITANPEFRINIYQMVNLTGFKYTVGAEFPKKYLIS